MGLPLLYPRNPLAFPGGVPGFDPSHPAVQGSYNVSVAYSSCGGINLLNGRGIVYTPNIDGVIGPGMGPAGGYYFNAFALAAPSSATSFTCAAIIRTAATLPNPGYVFSIEGSPNNNIGLAIRGGLWQFQVAGQTGYTISSPAPTVSTPYFIAFSNANSSANWVIVNLNTGQIYSGTLATTAVTGTYTYLNIGTNSTGKSWTGLLGPLMITWGNYLSLSALIQMAKRPWDFWYPPTVNNLLFAGIHGSYGLPPSFRAAILGV